MPNLALSLALLLSAPLTHASDEPLTCKGSLVPADAQEVALWPKGSLGSTMFVEVRPHGDAVQKGDVIARLDTKAQEKKVESAGDALTAARNALRMLRARQRQTEETDAAKTEQSERDLERASQALDDFLKVDIGYRRRSEDQRRRGQQAQIDDQEAELAQLESMYTEDELTDATEEIVLQRARRQLALSRESFQLSEERAAHKRDTQEPLEIARKRETLIVQQRAARHLATEMTFAQEARVEALRKSEKAVEEAEKEERLARDLLEMMTLRAPRAGVLLHGGIDDYRPGRVAPRYRHGSSAGLRTALFTIADPELWTVHFDIPESHRRLARDGMTAEVQLTFLGDRRLSGAISIDRHPSPKSAGGATNTYPATLKLGDRISGLSAGMRAEVTLESGEGE